MSNLVLSTKLYAPPPRSDIVQRTRLIQRLNEGVQEGKKLTLISAPAGFGKTTLVSEWIHISGFERKIAWLSIDEGDNDPARLLLYLAAALQKVDPSVGVEVQSALHSRQIPPFSELVGLLINDISRIEQPFLLILDDYHLITSLDVNPLMQLILERQPPSMHMVIITREDPTLPLSRLRVRGLLTEVRERDLRFSEVEAGSFLRQTMKLNLENDAVNALETQTEGWIAGLQLAGIALQDYPDASSIRQFITTFTGRDRYIADYLVNEVLASQPEEVSHFLMATSILENMCGSLCDAVLYDHENAGHSQEMLENLDRSNMFIVPLDNQRNWYRYHHLFSDLLRLRLARQGDTVLIPLHQHAAEWYAAHGMIDESLHHALAARNSNFAADLVNRNWRKAQHEGRPKTAIKWIEMLPKEIVASNALLSAAYAWILFLLGQTDALEEHIANTNNALARMAANGTLPEDDYEYISLPGQMAAIQALIALRRGKVELTQQFAREAIRVAPEQDTISLGLAWSALGSSYRDSGYYDEAIPCYYQAIKNNRASGNIIAYAIGMRHLGRVYAVQGRLQDAEELYTSGIETAKKNNQIHLPAFGILYVALGELNYEKNDLEKARSLLDEGLELGKSGGYIDLLLAVGILEARLRKNNGDMPGAIASLEDTYLIVHKMEDGAAEREINAWRAWLQAEIGNHPYALNWLENLPLYDGGPLSLARGIELFRAVRILMKLGKMTEALDLVSKLEAAADQANSAGRLIEALMLHAVLYAQQSNLELAAKQLEQAFLRAGSLGYYRLFLDEGSQLKPILDALLKTTKNPQIKTLIASLQHSISGISAIPTKISSSSNTPIIPIPSQAALVEPLSDRELEVLALMARGLTLAEIAKKMYLSPNTLKAHSQNIYSKLDAHSRVQAVNIARELGLIP